MLWSKDEAEYKAPPGPSACPSRAWGRQQGVLCSLPPAQGGCLPGPPGPLGSPRPRGAVLTARRDRGGRDASGQKDCGCHGCKMLSVPQGQAEPRWEAPRAGPGGSPICGPASSTRESGVWSLTLSVTASPLLDDTGQSNRKKRKFQCSTVTRLPTPELSTQQKCTCFRILKLLLDFYLKLKNCSEKKKEASSGPERSRRGK